MRSYLLVQPGDGFDADRIDKSLKALFATGLFSDVTLRREGDSLIVRVVENPVINRIAFEGNKKLSDQSLTDEIQLRPRIVYTREKVQSDVKRILDLYRRNSRFAATVDPKVIPLEQNRVDLVFEINEGPSTGIDGINFVGNDAFTASRLREVIQTKESRWYRFLSSDDTYDPDRMTYDRDLLRKFYLSEGYAEFRLVSAVAELAPARDGFLLTFSVDEGPRYHFGKIAVTNELPAVNPDNLRPLLKTKEGDWYNADAIEASVGALTDALGDLGYAFVDIQPQVHRNAEDRTVDVTYTIKEGPRVYVERIDITGNLRTLDKVIRREFRLVEGDAFNTSKLQRSEQRIKNLGYFKKFTVTNKPGSSPDKTVINAEVAGAVDRRVLRRRRLLDFRRPARRYRHSRAKSPRSRAGSAPRHRRRAARRAGGFELHRALFPRPQPGGRLRSLRRQPRQSPTFAGFSQFTVGTTLRMGYQITEPLRQTLKYTLRQDRIYNIQSTASTLIADQAGTCDTSDVGQVAALRPARQPPGPDLGLFRLAQHRCRRARRHRVAISASCFTGGVYYPVAPDYVLSFTGEGGHILGIGQNVQLEDRYYVGGDNLRGFQTGGVGPHDIVTDDALGGNNYYVGSVSTETYPLGLPEGIGNYRPRLQRFRQPLLDPSHRPDGGGFARHPRVVRDRHLVEIAARPDQARSGVPDPAQNLRSVGAGPRQLRHEVLDAEDRAHPRRALLLAAAASPAAAADTAAARAGRRRRRHDLQIMRDAKAAKDIQAQIEKEMNAYSSRRSRSQEDDLQGPARRPRAAAYRSGAGRLQRQVAGISAALRGARPRRAAASARRCSRPMARP